jgi:pimeloyl-ACP methyl ester carboxylesterase
MVRSGYVKSSLRVDVSDVAPKGCVTISTDVFWPDLPLRVEAEGPIVVFCFPGGGMSRRYFDLAIPGYSFAAHLSRLGYPTVIVDHPGVGDSDTPDDPWSLTPEVVADVDAAAVKAVLKVLQTGQVTGRPVVPSMVVGIGHSAGALVVLHQQARSAPFNAIGLLGWAGHGLPEHLDEDERAWARHPDRTPLELVERARKRHHDPLVNLPRGSSTLLMANPLPPDVHAALVEARSPLLAIVGYASMIPGSTAHCAQRVTVPVFLGVGDRDIARNHLDIPKEFPLSRDVTVFLLHNSGHNHNVEPTRTALWDRLASWVWSVS